MNGQVGENSGIFQTINQGSVLIAAVLGAGPHDHVAHGINGHAAGNVARECPAHAIGNDQHQTPLAQFEVRQLL